MDQKTISNTENHLGCTGVVLVVFLSLWVIAFSAINITLSWTVEQVMFETSVGVQDFRWINQAVYALLVLVPCLLVALLSKHPWIKKVSWLWMLGAIFAFLCIPVKTQYLYSQNLTAILQLGAILLMLVVVKLMKARKSGEPQPERSKIRLVGLAAVVGLGLSIPWGMWGALGSILDTFLAVAVGGLLATLIVQIIFPTYLESAQLPGSARPSGFLRDGFVIAVLLLMVSASIAQNGSHQLLVTTLPVCGWLVVMFSAAGGEGNNDRKAAIGLILALAVALPLAFFDMDELSMAITGSAGEILDWSSQAAFYTLLGILMVSIILLANSKVLKIIRVSGKVNRGLVFFALISFFLIYFLVGQAGFFGDRIFVILKSQAGLAQTRQIEGVSDRRQAVYEELVSHALQSQAGLRQKLEKWNLQYTPYYLLNAMEVDGGTLVRLLLASDPSVDRILESPQLRPLPKPVQGAGGDLESLPAGSTWNLSMVGADRVVSELGVDGSGILIGQTDSGVDGRHPEVQSTYRGVTTGDDFNWYDPWNQTPFPVDRSGHGTGTLSVILGENIGVAPEADWIGCVNLARNLGNPAKYLDCMQFMLAPFPQGGDPFMDGEPQRGANIVNNSWGCPEIEGCDPRIFEPAMTAMKVAGVFMSSAAGNSGNYGCGTVSDPLAIYADVFTTGSVGLTGNLSSFSSIGPVIVDGSGRTKPDLLAPGEGVTVAFPGGGYSVVSGTSFAAPHLSGIVALMWSANPALIGDIDGTTRILLETAQSYAGEPPVCGDKAAATGAGIVDAYAAVKAALEY
jgi:subtilisin family serine protease